MNGNEGKASARSIVGFDIGSLIIAATQNKILLKGGGHKMAGGFTIHKSKIEEFKDFVISKFKNKSSEVLTKKEDFKCRQYNCSRLL